MYRLKFNEQLSVSATKPISVSDLLKRLRALSVELEGLDQENVDRSSLGKVATQLASNNLLQHKNKGITAYVSCCIADLLRLCAPDAPFSQSQLKSIFECFTKQLKGLSDIESTYYQQYYYLLESLATVESIVLVGDVEKGDELTVDIFRCFFDLGQDDRRRQSAEDLMVSIMSQLINELPQLPPDVLKILLAQLMRSPAAESTRFSQRHAAYSMAKSVFNACADRLQRNICQYFTDVIFDASQADPKDNTGEPTDDQLRIAHDLVHELFICAPSTLQNTIPQLESELNVENILCRSLATRTISSMLASINGGMLYVQYPTTYRTWAGRRNDKSVTIRTMWIEGIGQILASAGGAIRQVEVEQLCIDGLVTRLVDPDDRVRSAACNVIENLDYKTCKARLTIGVLKTYSERCRDRKPLAQEAAFRHIGQLFDWAYSDIAAGDLTAKEKFAPLVNYILHCLYVNDLGLNILLERTLYRDLLKCEEPDGYARGQRALYVLKLSDERSRRALFAIVGQQQKVYAQYLSQFLKVCDKYNGGIVQEQELLVEQRLATCIKWLAAKFPDASTAEADLLLFAKNNDRRCYKLLNECINSTNDATTIRKMSKESIKRIGQVSGQVASTFEVILNKASFQFYNDSNIATIRQISLESGQLSDLANIVLKEVSLVHPNIYKAHIEPMLTEIRLEPLLVSVDTLKALALFARLHNDDVPCDRSLCDAMTLLVREGSQEQAKQAATIYCSMPQETSQLRATMVSMVDELTYDSIHFLTHLAAIAQVILLAPDLLEEKATEITTYCVKELLTKHRNLRQEDEKEEWIEDEAVPVECSAKCYAIRILGNRLRAYHSADTATEIAKPVFKALRSMIVNMGELSKKEETPLCFRSRIRLEAAKMCLKLATLPVYEKMINATDFNQIALFAQDLEYNVRRSFLTRLQKSLAADKLPPRWYSIIFLAAHDPEDEIKREIMRRVILLTAQHRESRLDSAGQYLIYLGDKDFLMESMTPRLVHLLAHHPDFLSEDRDDDDLVNFATYFCFYFDSIATADNLVLIYHYCQRIKQVADAVPHDNIGSDVSIRKSRAHFADAL